MAFKVFIDPGHGGKDPGAVGNGLYEKNITLAIGLELAKYFKNNYDGVEVALSRVTDVYLTLKQRTDAANKWGADFLISIHINSATNSTANGFSSHIHDKPQTASVAAQNVIHRAIWAQGLWLKDRGQLRDNFHMVRESKMPALLTENGFISNAADAAKLKQSETIYKTAEGHAKGIAQMFGLKVKAGGNSVYTDITGHWAAKDIEYLREKNVMLGYIDKTFRPDEPMTRAEFASVIAKIVRGEVKP